MTLMHPAPQKFAHRHIVTHGYHNVKLVFHISEKQNSGGSDFEGDASLCHLEQG